MAVTVPASVIEEIKDRTSLSDLISSYGIAVRIAGGSKKACCPFHHEKTPSFNINDDKGYYHCFGCGESGDAIKFVEKMDGVDFIEAVKKLAQLSGVEIKEREDPEAGRRRRLLTLLAEVAEFYHRCLLQIKEAAIAREYLRSRDLDEKVQEDYQIGYAPAGIGNMLIWAKRRGYSEEELQEAGLTKMPSRPGDRGYHRFGGRLMFSITDKSGRVVGFSGRQLVESKNSGKYVNSPETAVFKKSNVLYGFDKAMPAIARSPNREVIVCEGQIDCIRMQTSGFANTVAGQGTAFTAEHVRMLKRVADQVALVYDDDGAGRKATIKSARLCLAAELPVRVVSLPGGDDPDSFLRTHPAEDFRSMLESAESIMSFQVRVERAKERDPGSVDAVNRIVREVISTIAVCPGAVMRTTMVREAAKLLGLPTEALLEELSKVKTQPVKIPEDPVVEEALKIPQEPDDPPITGEDAAAAATPPGLEMALCEFLMANEAGEETNILDGIIGEFLPPEAFAHGFTRDFISAWRRRISLGEDAIAAFGQGLSPRESAWFASILSGQEKAAGCSQRPVEVLEDFVRLVWAERLKRMRGELPAVGHAEADMKRMKISMDLKRLNSVKWGTVKDMVREWIKGGQHGSETSN